METISCSEMNMMLYLSQQQSVDWPRKGVDAHVLEYDTLRFLVSYFIQVGSTALMASKY